MFASAVRVPPSYSSMGTATRATCVEVQVATHAVLGRDDAGDGGSDRDGVLGKLAARHTAVECHDSSRYAGVHRLEAIDLLKDAANSRGYLRIRRRIR